MKCQVCGLEGAYITAKTKENKRADEVLFTVCKECLDSEGYLEVACVWKKEIADAWGQPPKVEAETEPDSRFEV